MHMVLCAPTLSSQAKPSFSRLPSIKLKNLSRLCSGHLFEGIGNKKTLKGLQVFPGEVPGKFQESSGKVPGKFRESSGKTPGKFRKFRASSGNYGQVPKEDSGIGLAWKFWQNPQFRKFRGSSGNSGEVPGKFRRSSGASSGKIPETFRNRW